MFHLCRDLVMIVFVVPSHVMDMLDDLGSKVRNSFDSFVVRAPKITLLSTKTVGNNTSTSTSVAQHPQISVRGSSLALSVEPSAPSSCATARDQLTNDNKRLLRRKHSLRPIDEEEESVRILVRATTLALRRVVQQQGGQSSQGSTRRDSRRLRESKFRRHQAAFLEKDLEQAPVGISGHDFKRREGAAFVAPRQRSM